MVLPQTRKEVVDVEEGVGGFAQEKADDAGGAAALKVKCGAQENAGADVMEEIYGVIGREGCQVDNSVLKE